MSRTYTSSWLTKSKQKSTTAATYQARASAIKERLKQLGAGTFDLRVPETSALAYLLNADEVIDGIVYGRYNQESEGLVGRGALVATDARVLLIDKKPLLVHSDEGIYPAVSGVTYTRIGFISVVTLHSKIGDIKVRTMNQKCAKSFVEAVEARILKML